MARRRRTRRRAAAPRARARTRTRTVRQIVYRTRRAGRAARRLVRRRDESLNIGKIVRGSFAAAFGMVVAKVAVNKLTTGGSETEKWTWPNIFMAAGSSVVIAFVCGAVFKMKKPTVAWIAVGGAALAVYKAFTTKFAPQWSWTQDWFGADSDINPALLGEGESDFEVVDYAPQSVGALPGQIMGATDTGGRVLPYNPNMGSTDSGGRTVAFNPNMGAADYGSMSRMISSGYPGSY